MGTPAFAVPALRSVAERCDVVRVVTRPDRPAGRGRHTVASPVASAAEALGLPTSKPATMRAPEVRDALAAERADVFAVVAFGAILSPELLDLPRAGCLNLHGSLLPDYRGAAPVQRALWDGRATTGACTLFMDEGIDTGDVVLALEEPIRDDDDAGTLATRLAARGGPLLAESCELAHEGRAPRRPQDRAAGSYAAKLRKADGAVDWTLPAREVWNHARAVTPWPGATAGYAGRRLLVLACRPESGSGAPGEVLDIDRSGVAVACGQHAVRLTQVKPEGRGALAASEWAHGARLVAGNMLTGGREFVS
ncbi:MAG TPA: methionyl-tRNA formyltransferase [Candidatus Acidoferrales bacterium]|nr:methionyl-tRNA formyltransferase [Candidatus Acidoferrales bacterium]